MRAAVVATALKKYYGSFTAVDGIDFTIDHGQVFGILGPNGAGKTTTVAMIYCFLPVDGGSLAVAGMDVQKQARAVKACLGVVPQENNLDLELTVLDNLLIYASYFGIDKETARRRAWRQLELFGLADRASAEVETLSGGMKRRLTIARSMMNEPEILVLDEPTYGLDPEARRHIWQRIRSLKDSGLTVILTTHYMEEASQLCDKLIIMDRGKILEEGSPLELIRKHVGTQVIEAEVPPEMRPGLLGKLGDLRHGHVIIGDTMYFFAESEGHGLDFFLSKLPGIRYLSRRPANLEDVFLKLTGRGFNNG